jgi:hypothetical protein
MNADRWKDCFFFVFFLNFVSKPSLFLIDGSSILQQVFIWKENLIWTSGLSILQQML